MIKDIGDTTLYAQWSYSIIFNSNGGNGVMSNQIINNNKTINLSNNTYTKDGYDFKEWNTKIDGTGTSYLNEGEITDLGNTTLYAQWKIMRVMVVN